MKHSENSSYKQYNILKKYIKYAKFNSTTERGPFRNS